MFLLRFDAENTLERPNLTSGKSLICMIYVIISYVQTSLYKWESVYLLSPASEGSQWSTLHKSATLHSLFSQTKTCSQVVQTCHFRYLLTHILMFNFDKTNTYIGNFNMLHIFFISCTFLFNLTLDTL